jgi:hypothetical protein
MARQAALFTTIRSEGGLLPSDLLALIASGDKSVPGVEPADYHFSSETMVRQKINHEWQLLCTAWKNYTARLSAMPENDKATTLTREGWLLILFESLGFGRLKTHHSYEVAGKPYSISHGVEHVPIHLVSAKIELDRRTANTAGAARHSPHSLVQQLLNASEDHLWGFVSNGRILRILRDNATLTRQAFIEFDLETMFSSEVFSDFEVMWRVCHQSRVEAENPRECWLEKWSSFAAQSGTRARDDLRIGVEAAIELLGEGFVSHPQNLDLRRKIQSGELPSHDLYRQLLRIIYRLLFLFVAEDRGLLHTIGSDIAAQSRYAEFYSLSRIRKLARRRIGGPHPDLWESLTVVFRGLGKTSGIPELALPGLGSFLWSPAACMDLNEARIANEKLLPAIKRLAFVEDRGQRVSRSVDYRNLGTEELGAIYESLLEQHPEVDTDAGKFKLNTAAGNERKTTGSYYTPTSLITELLNSAVDPVIAEAAAKPNPEQAILELSVIDPACGSGHFLIAAAHRIAKKLASVRTGDEEPSPDATRTALRDVISHCIYGIDMNPMAVELCKVSLWIESMEPGKPLSFLDHRIVRGNALIGATPELLEKGIPQEAFVALTGDDKAAVSNLKKVNRQGGHGQRSLFKTSTDAASKQLAEMLKEIDAAIDTDARDIEAKAAAWQRLVTSPGYVDAVHAANTWCAVFVAPKRFDALGISQAEYELAKDSPHEVNPVVRATVDVLAGQFGFLHWHLAFPSVFECENPGFDLVLGNPPWEKVKLSEKEFFAVRAPDLAKLAGAKRKAAIARLSEERPLLWDDYQFSLRQAEAESHFIRNSGRYPLCGRGDVNTYAIFAEVMRDAVSPTGCAGVIVPTGIATDDTTKQYFAEIVGKRQLASLFDFENRQQIFPGVDSRTKFSLMTLSGRSRPVDQAEFVFFAHQTSDLLDPERRFTLSPEDFALINPNTKTAPIFRTRRDAEITKGIYRRVSVLVRDDHEDGNPWGIEYQRMFDMTNDSQIFRTAEELQAEGAGLQGNIWVKDALKWLPLYEAKMAHHFNHRFGDYAMRGEEGDGSSLPDVPLSDLQDSAYVVQPRYWVEDSLAVARRRGTRSWRFGFRNIARATDERTWISNVVPESAVGNNLPLLVGSNDLDLLLPSVMASFVCDFVARQKLGSTTMNWFVAEQIAVLHPNRLGESCPWFISTVGEWMASRALELTYTAWDLKDFALDLGYPGPPFRWDPARRELLRAELDAAFFHLYGIERDDVDYIMDTFPIIKRKDEVVHSEYRTKRLILERYDALGEAAAKGAEYQTVLDPPPADPRCAHPESTRPAWA